MDGPAAHDSQSDERAAREGARDVPARLQEDRERERLFHGNVETVRIITDQFTGRPRGFGFVEMATKEEAQKAVEMLNGRLFRDRNLVVDEARPQPQRGGGGGGGGGPRGDRGPRSSAGGGGWRR